MKSIELMKDNQIGIEIIKSVPLSFSYESESIDPDILQRDDHDILLSSEFGIDKKNSQVGVRISIKLISKKGEEIFEITSLFHFFVPNLETIILDVDGNDRLDPSIARKFLNISIGGTRGMLSVHLLSTPYKGFTLPIATISDEILAG